VDDSGGQDGSEPESEGPAPEPKPAELLALHGVSGEMFDMLRRWFAVPDHLGLDLSEVDSAVTELGDPVMIAGMAMRKLQALNLLATPGVLTTTDVVVSIVSDLDRALVQAPSMRLQLQADTADWDAALLELDTPEDDGAVHPSASTDADPEVERFQMLHVKLHEAVRAVLQASEREIRHFL